jgi:tripartite-type tricarboxylate transporter receptor subunit TctC
MLQGLWAEGAALFRPTDFYKLMFKNKYLHYFSAWMASAAALACLSSAYAAYPDRPIRMIVPSTPGGGTDLATRMVMPKLSEFLGQPIVIDNRGGASGNLGAELGARAAPDGYTLTAAIASLTSNASLMKKVPFDIERDFAPIAMTVIVPNLLVSHPAVPASNVRELIAHIKSRPGQMQFASAGVGSMPHLMMEFFVSMAGLKMIHVPYKGAGPALVDLIAGHVPLMAANILSSLPQVKAGRLRAYGVTSARRSPGAPDIPTIAEAGLPGYDAVTWFGVLAPAGTPRAIVTQLHTNVVRAVNDPGVRKRFIDDGADPSPSASPEAFAMLIRSEVRKWAKVIRDAGIQPE